MAEEEGIAEAGSLMRVVRRAVYSGGNQATLPVLS
jgi:hypothetical protein